MTTWWITARQRVPMRAALLLWLCAWPCLLPAQSGPAVSASSAPAPAPFDDVRRQRPIQGNASAGAAKAAICGACHGQQGIAIAPNFPSLAGQSATYLYLQLRQFKFGQIHDPVMGGTDGQAALLDDTAMRDLATHFATLARKAGGPADASSRGGQLYLQGDPARGAPPCQGCHGPAGRGPEPYAGGGSAPPPPWATFPRLAGLSPLYVTKALGDFRSGARGDSSNARIMQGVVQNLSEDDMRALAAYIGSL